MENPDQPASTPGAGQALSRSDTADVPDSALSSGDILFIEWTHREELLDLAGVPESDLPYASFVFDPTQLAALDGTGVSIEKDGHFPIPVPPGDHTVCLANVFAGQTSGPPYAVVGCTSAELSADTTMTVWHGEGGVEVTLD